MSITVKISDDKTTATISVSGRFDFSLHNEFRKSYKDAGVKGGSFVLDLASTEYMDSSALGMLLMLKEFADSAASKIRIIHINNDIRDILTIASFDKLFTLE